ncbi:MAG: hypothetical protein RL398_2660, partial [Planctomycetota bacterium]
MRSLSFLVATSVATLVALLSVVLGLAARNAFAIADAADVIRVDAERAREHELPLLLAAKDLRFHVVQVQQWLTDISATRAAEGYADGFDEAAVHAERCRELLARFAADDQEPAVAQAAGELREAFEAYYAKGRDMARAYIDGGPAAGNKAMDEFDAFAERMTDAVDPFVAAQETAFRAGSNTILQAAEHARSMAGAAFWWMLAALVTPIVGGCLLFAFLRRNVVAPIRAQAATLAALRAGDLTARCPTVRIDELGRIRDGIDGFADEMGKLVTGMLQAAGSLDTQAKITAETGQGLAAEATRQAASFEEISAAMRDMLEQTRLTTKHVEAVREDARATHGAGAAGADDVAKLEEAMGLIESSSEEVRRVLSTIDEIAFQTNLLALNAAVEAA